MESKLRDAAKRVIDILNGAKEVKIVGGDFIGALRELEEALAATPPQVNVKLRYGKHPETGENRIEQCVCESDVHKPGCQWAATPPGGSPQRNVNPEQCHGRAGADGKLWCLLREGHGGVCEFATPAASEPERTPNEAEQHRNECENCNRSMVGENAVCLTCWNKLAAPPAQGAPTPSDKDISSKTIALEEAGKFLCAARHSDTGPNDPQDCDWPTCGCDQYADKVIEALQESGKLAAQGAPGTREALFWLIHFEDRDREDIVTLDEAAARRMYADAKVSWECALFVQVPADLKEAQPGAPTKEPAPRETVTAELTRENADQYRPFMTWWGGKGHKIPAEHFESCWVAWLAAQAVRPAPAMKHVNALVSRGRDATSLEIGAALLADLAEYRVAAQARPAPEEALREWVLAYEHAEIMPSKTGDNHKFDTMYLDHKRLLALRLGSQPAGKTE